MRPPTPTPASQLSTWRGEGGVWQKGVRSDFWVWGQGHWVPREALNQDGGQTGWDGGTKTSGRVKCKLLMMQQVWLGSGRGLPGRAVLGARRHQISGLEVFEWDRCIVIPK